MKHKLFKKPGPSPTPPCRFQPGPPAQLGISEKRALQAPGLDCNSDRDKTEDYSQEAPACGRAWGQEARAESVARMGATGG